VGARRIGERLVAAGLISAAELAEAVQLQIVHGARLGTNLVEHCELDLDALTRHLAHQHGLPAALASDFESADEQVQRSLPPELAARWLCVPVRLIGGAAARVLVAACDPLPEQAIDELSIALGLPIEPAIAAELRIFYHLEHVYGFERPNRFKRVRRDQSIELPIFFEEDDELEATEPRINVPGRERRRFITGIDEADEQGEPSREVLARIPIRRASNVLLAEEDPHRDLGNIDDAVRAIKRATGRDKVGDLVVEALRRGFGEELEVGMVLVLREGMAVGWKGFVRGGLDGLVELVAIPLGMPSAIAKAVHLGSDYAGPPMDDAPIETRLWKVLEVLRPAQLAAVPVPLFGELVCVLYGHVRRDGAISDAASGMRQLADAVSSAFERLTRAAQR
jgi:hypothetical protein